MNKEEMIEYVKCRGGIETPKGWNIPDSVDISNQNLKEIPIQFNIVEGYFDCSCNKLTYLKGCPKIVTNDFLCDYNYLTSLKWSPKEIQHSFYCNNNKLISLKYAPKIVKGSFACEDNQLTSFKYAPKILGRYFFARSIYSSKNAEHICLSGEAYYIFLLKEKAITEAEYLLTII